jgi:tetratricopeptide (TPR) repeat protein
MPRRGILIQMKSHLLKLYAMWIFVLPIGILPKSLHAEIDTDLLPAIGETDSHLRDEMETNVNSTNFDQPDLKTPRAYIHHAETRVSFRDYKGAFADLNKAIKLDPYFAPAYRDRAFVEHRLGYDDDSFADCSKAIELNPRFARAYNDRGIVEMDSFRDYKDAIADFSKTIELNPAFAPPYINRAWVKRRLDDSNGALQDLNKAIEIDPGHATVYALRGCIQNDLSHFQDALNSFRRAVEINPADEKCRIRIWLISARLGERTNATVELAEHLKSLPRAYLTRWPVPVERFLTDTLDEKDVLESANIPLQSPRVLKEPLCEANYYVGMKHLLAEDKTGASGFFQKAIDTDIVGYSEYESAAVELSAIKTQ